MLIRLIHFMVFLHYGVDQYIGFAVDARHQGIKEATLCRIQWYKSHIILEFSHFKTTTVLL